MKIIKMESITRWKVNIFNAIREIADIETQKLSWKGKHPLIVSSLDEVINILYDDYEFEEYLKYLQEKESNTTPLYLKMINLNEIINEFLEEGQGNEVLDDPEWLKITQLANEVIEEWIAAT